ncbi:DUF3833 domain-containing protein [Marinomonas mediterranea]|jgi:hypothetical protein|uniref:Putative lipoprotein n=1 Tax=Marinomonas mediterranea (strain ATCC 700492 / JCM 21426 / NBRC 103028 / MMB-1) TaxID=717774 RepID=F2JZJ4_MARM1|nr:DUF3833 domain-containing protein [Marinomonas mediterranea]ADZ89777.1 putative lipoprotein [Marinomonas mediterranea MMB-1]WCN07867.1 DUF3833 family protein [Marinomonas mediterranea]WCN16000.1 DUF3833 family protein [Marinomonas mediterranea MMB-1]
MKAILITLFALVLSACSSPNIELYKSNKPEFILSEFFNGELSAHGVLKNRSGEVIRYFNARLKGSWVEGKGTLEEWFVFDDGEEHQRVWKLVPNDRGSYDATANDVNGTAEAKFAGNALFMKYELQVPYDGDIISVMVDDRMYLVDKNVVINESVMSKFGVDVGYITLTIVKKSQD